MSRLFLLPLVLSSILLVLPGCEATDRETQRVEEQDTQRGAVTTRGERDTLTADEREAMARRDTTWRQFRNDSPHGRAQREPARRGELSQDVLTSYQEALAIPLSDDAEGRAVLYAQILLDRAGFSPGQIDGLWGQNTEKAVYWFQRSAGIDATGTLDSETLHQLARMADAPDQPEDLIATHSLTSEDVEGPFTTIPDEVQDQAEMDWLGYESLAEKLGERFHASPGLLSELNDGRSMDTASEGETIRVPDVRDARPRWAGAAHRVIVSDGGRYLHVLDRDGGIAYHFPATLGAEYDPSPQETLEVEGIAHEPAWHYQPAILARVDDDEEEAIVPPGPNNPVGLVWINLTKEHYGIHGTDAPGTIGYATSAGCVRLTNWDVQFLADLVEGGTIVEFRDGAGRDQTDYGT